jgi:hypothetical protein
MISKNITRIRENRQANADMLKTYLNVLYYAFIGLYVHLVVTVMALNPSRNKLNLRTNYFG